MLDKRQTQIVGLGLMGVIGVCAVGLMALGRKSEEPGKPETVPVLGTEERFEYELRKVFGERLEHVSTGKEVLVSFAIDEKLSASGIKSRTKQDVTESLLALKNSGLPYESIQLKGHGTAVDKFGNKKILGYVNVTFSKETVEKIRFENFRKEDVYDVADNALVHHSFR